MADESSTGEASGGQDAPMTEDVDEVVELKDNVCVDPFQTEILKGRAARAPAHHTHIMIVLIRCAEVESGKACPLPPGLQVYMLTPHSQLVVSMSRSWCKTSLIVPSFLRKVCM